MNITPGNSRILTFLRKFLRANTGNIAILFALSLLPIAGVVGAGLDYTLAVTSRSKLQNAADAAALAASKEWAKNPNITDSQLQILTNEVFHAQAGNLSLTKDINVAMVRLEAGIRVDVTAKVETRIVRVIGFDEIDIKVFSETAASFSKIELALVLDNTGSMGSGGKMQALKNAANTLIDTIIPPNADEDMVKISIVPYDVTVNIGIGYLNASWLTGENRNNNPPRRRGRRGHHNNYNIWCGLVKPANTDYIPVVSPSDIYAYNEPCGTLPTIQTLTGQTNILKTKISQMSPNGWTYIPTGLMWGWRTLDPNEPFTQAKPYNDPEWQKIIVLMTDGDNTAKWSNGRLFTNRPSGPGDAKTRKICRDVKAKNIRIFTVAFGYLSSSSTRLLRRCASSETDFYAAYNPSELTAAFAAIAGNINKMRLSR